MKRSSLSLAAVLGALAVAAAGCGGGGNGTEAGAPETAPGPGGETVAGETSVETVAPPIDTGVEGPVECSGSVEAGLVLEQQDLPAPVAELRERLFAAATSCDYEELGEIASASEGFTYTFGQQTGDPAAFWREQEEQVLGDPTYALATVLTLPFARNESGSFVWPSAAGEGATDADWQAILDAFLYTTPEVTAMREAGTGYTGWRTAITPAGEWQFFVAGD